MKYLKIFLLEVKITKISPEAPVMVISPKNNNKTYLGGAGNVLQNLLSAKLNARLISLAGIIN